MRISFDKIDRFIIPLDGKIKHLILFDYGLFSKICDNIKYLISKKSGITNSINHNFGKIRIDSYNSLSIKKILTFHNVIMLNKSVVNKNKNKYYYNIFLEKASYKDKSMFVYYKCYIMIESSLLIVSSLFQDQVLFFLYVFHWKNEYILNNVSRVPNI